MPMVWNVDPSTGNNEQGDTEGLGQDFGHSTTGTTGA
jgi:hypothetical protein